MQNDILCNGYVLFRALDKIQLGKHLLESYILLVNLYLALAKASIGVFFSLLNRLWVYIVRNKVRTSIYILQGVEEEKNRPKKGRSVNKTFNRQHLIEILTPPRHAF